MPDRRSWGESRGSRNLFRLPPEASVSLSIRSEAVRKHRPLELGLHSVVRWFTRFLEPNDPCGERIQGGPFHSFLGHESESRYLFKSVRCPSRGRACVANEGYNDMTRTDGRLPQRNRSTRRLYCKRSMLAMISFNLRWRARASIRLAPSLAWNSQSSTASQASLIAFASSTSS